jgi:hypothetical protein
MGIAKNISIGTTTNGTIYTSDLEHIIKNFKHVYIGLSVEAMHSVNDYVRWPSQIDSVVDIIKKFISLREHIDLHLSLRITPNIFTIGHIDTVFEFMLENSIIAESCNVLQNPSCLRIELLPKKLVDAIINKINKIIEKYNLIKPTQWVVNRRNNNVKHLVISDIIFEYKNLLETMLAPENVEEERYNKFEWDHLIRIDIPQDREVLFYSEDKKTLEAFWHGYQLAYEIVNVDVFEDNCKKLSQRILENEKDFNFIPPREDK